MHLTVAKSENGTLPHETELNPMVTKPLKDGSTRSDGEVTHSSGSHSHFSKKSRSSFDKTHFPRHELQTMMLLGKNMFFMFFFNIPYCMQSTL